MKKDKIIRVPEFIRKKLHSLESSQEPDMEITTTIKDFPEQVERYQLPPNTPIRLITGELQKSAFFNRKEGG